MLKQVIDLETISDEDLLGVRLCDLPLKIEGTWLEECVRELYSELDGAGIVFKPEVYLADEWLTPDKEPVLGIAFFLAHPRLMKLERKMMMDVEGGARQWCLRLLRHEMGHVINYAYKLFRRKSWQDVFGEFNAEYGDTYRFRPYSKNFVRHLEDYYAQYHPDEDFAETFSVWLTPGSNWQEQYKGWKACNKLDYVDKLLKEIKNKPPLVKTGMRCWSVAEMKITLKNFYKKKLSFHAEDFPDFHDLNLKKIFIEKSEVTASLPDAHSIIKKSGKNIINGVSTWTGERKYIIHELVQALIGRCRELSLKSNEPEAVTISRISIYITALIMNYLYTGRFRGKK